MPKNFLLLRDVGAYKIAFKLSNEIWNMCVQWNYFAKDTIGKQMVRSADSISANVAEGFGRYSKKDKIKFYRYAFGSTKETMDWTLKAYHRTLMNKQQYSHIMGQLNQLPLEINSLIKFTNERLQT